MCERCYPFDRRVRWMLDTIHFLLHLHWSAEVDDATNAQRRKEVCQIYDVFSSKQIDRFGVKRKKKVRFHQGVQYSGRVGMSKRYDLQTIVPVRSYVLLGSISPLHGVFHSQNSSKTTRVPGWCGDRVICVFGST